MGLVELLWRKRKRTSSFFLSQFITGSSLFCPETPLTLSSSLCWQQVVSQVFYSTSHFSSKLVKPTWCCSHLGVPPRPPERFVFSHLCGWVKGMMSCDSHMITCGVLTSFFFLTKNLTSLWVCCYDCRFLKRLVSSRCKGNLPWLLRNEAPDVPEILRALCFCCWW